jgi:hypothetical protein
MMEAVRTSETSIYFNETTEHNTAEGCNLREITTLYVEDR